METLVEEMMQSDVQSSGISKKALWAGRIFSAIGALFLLADSLGKFFKPQAVVQGTIELGYPESVITGLGIVLLISTLIYLFPRTSVLGAILLTGYLGGAVATHVRIGNPWLTHILFPAYVALFLWGGLYLRDIRVRSVIPFVKS